MQDQQNPKSIFSKEIPHFRETGDQLFEKSKEIVLLAQAKSGAVSASLPGTRYSGFLYPRDHGYATRALVAANEMTSAHKALRCILASEIDENDILYQRYTSDGRNASYKPPQIDGNAQTLLAFTSFIQNKNSNELHDYFSRIKQLTQGILSQTKTFAHGNLVYSINGIIEFSPFEAGYDLYTNAVCYRALLDISHYPKIVGEALADEAKLTALAIQKGIKKYLYYPKEKTFLSCLRAEPDSSYVMLPNLKNYLALSDFEVIDASDELLAEGLTYHLNGTTNKELGGYNRYHALMGRHNFGNGPWPMVMLRLAQFYIKANQKKKALSCFTWVLNAAKNNLDQPGCLPEHIATKEAFLEEYQLFKMIDETSPRPAKEKEYELMLKSKTMKQLGLAYAVNPLMWSHAQFILAWSSLYPDILSHSSQSSFLY